MEFRVCVQNIKSSADVMHTQTSVILISSILNQLVMEVKYQADSDTTYTKNMLVEIFTGLSVFHDYSYYIALYIALTNALYIKNI